MKQVEKNRESFLKYGISDEVIDLLLVNKYTISKVKAASQNDLQNFLSNEQAKDVKGKLKRKQIEDSVFKRLLIETEFSCCFCWDIKKEQPIIIHHIDPYNETQDNSFNNLIVLCLNHHGEVHTKREISQQNYSKTRLLIKKGEYIEAISAFKRGERPAPGSEIKENKKIDVKNSPGSINTIDQHGNNTVNNITISNRKVLTSDMKTKMLDIIIEMGVSKILLRYEHEGATILFSEQIYNFFISEGYKVLPRTVTQGGMGINLISIDTHPDPEYAIVCIGSIV